MNKITPIEKFLLIGHIGAMVFGLAGLILVLPHPQFIASLPEIGKTAFALSMSGGGVVYMLLGMGAVAVYAYRSLGAWGSLTFMIPAIALSLGSELLGTSTGFPFGEYRYLSGLGYKIGGLVPFTIPLSWFYVGFSAYIIAKTGLKQLPIAVWLQEVSAISLGALLLTSWDFVLDPAMSQTTMPFWVWDQPGAFFGMPYQNFVGWMATGIVFMSVAAILWQFKSPPLPSNLGLPLAVYSANFAFGAILSLAAGFYLPVVIGLIVGIAPLIILFRWGQNTTADVTASTFNQVTVGAVQE